MAKQHPQKSLIRMLYIEQGYDAKHISNLPGIQCSENSIGKWVKDEKWKEQRTARTLSPDKLIVYYYEQSEAIILAAKNGKRGVDSGEADALNKLASAIQKLDKKVDPSVTMAVFKAFNNYMMQVNPKLAKDNAEHQLNYVQQLLDEQG